MRNDEGSALPMFVFGIVLLLFLSTVVLRAGQMLEQQRRLNGASDSIALDLAQREGATQLDATTLGAWATADAASFYAARKIAVAEAFSDRPGRASVRLCEPGTWTQVCAQSTAELR